MFKVQVKSWREDRSLVSQFSKSKEFNPQVQRAFYQNTVLVSDKSEQGLHWSYRFLSSLVYTIPMCSIMGVFSGQMASAALVALSSLAYVAVVAHKKELVDDVRLAIQDSRLSS